MKWIIFLFFTITGFGLHAQSNQILKIEKAA
ncbi:MAG: hypothetical protein ACI9J3_002858, partial [Parvicellaceae bacterium]